MQMPDFEPGAATFDEQRGLPEKTGQELCEIVLTRLPAGREGRLLETGIGTGRIAAPFLAAGCRYVGLDASPAMLERCWERLGSAGGQLSLILGDMARMPIPNEAFTAVLAASVYRVATPWQIVATETSRVLTRPGFFFLIQHEVAPGSMEDVLRQRKREIFTRFSVDANQEGGATDAEVARFFIDQGATVETVQTSSWISLRTPRSCIRRFQRGSHMSDRSWADTLLAELESFALMRYGSLEAEEMVARTLRVYVIQLATV